MALERVPLLFVPHFSLVFHDRMHVMPFSYKLFSFPSLLPSGTFVL
jgi:hypothetical protein